MPEVAATRFRTVDELRAILNQAPIGICVVGPDFFVIESNPTLDDMLGLAAERFHGMHVSEITHPDDAASARDTYQSLAAGGKHRAELEGRYRRGDGTWFWGLLTLGVVRTSSGTVDYYVAMVEDITARKRSEQAQRDTEREMRALFEAAPVGVVFADPGGRLQRANPAFCQMLGYASEELAGARIEDLIHPEDRDQARDANQMLLDADGGRSLELRFVRKSGLRIWTEWTAVALRDAQGRPTSLQNIVRDVTQRHLDEQELRRAMELMKEANQKLDQVNASKGQLISLVSHEFRTALTSVQGFSEMIRDEDLTNEEVNEYSAEIFSEAQRLNRMISDMLDIDRIESGRMMLRREPTDFAGLIRSAVRSGTALGRQIDLELGALPVLEVDGDKFMQVLSNLIGNAIKYSPNGGAVRVAATADHEKVRVGVSDQGMGIPGDALESVFERFSRVESGEARHIHGTGLGLAICRQIVELHGGRIWVESEDAKGSTFYFTVPLQYTVDAP